MRKISNALFAIFVLLLAGYRIFPVLAQQQQDAATQTAPPAYTPPPLGAAPMEDTPAQREALAQLKAQAEQASVAARKAHNATVNDNYNFHYGDRKSVV